MGDRGGIRGFLSLLQALRDPGRTRLKISGAKRKICKNFSNEKENGRKSWREKENAGKLPGPNKIFPH